MTIPLLRIATRIASMWMVVHGVWMIFPPLGFIVCGIALWVFADITKKDVK